MRPRKYTVSAWKWEVRKVESSRWGWREKLKQCRLTWKCAINWGMWSPHVSALVVGTNVKRDRVSHGGTEDLPERGKNYGYQERWWMFGITALENGRSSSRKHEFIVAPGCVAVHFPRETLDCLVQEWGWKMFAVTPCALWLVIRNHIWSSSLVLPQNS